jgi:hypothetical protein
MAALLHLMKRSISIWILASVILAGVTLNSCTKRGPTTIDGKIQGKWKKIQYATDDNGNGIIDQSEISQQPATISDELLFKGDYTGSETTVIDGNKSTTQVLNFSWRVTNDSLWLEYAANDTISYYIVNVNTSNLTLQGNNGQGLVWYNYGKD